MTLRVKHKVEFFLDQTIVGVQPVGGGCIADTSKITTDQGSVFFLKSSALKHHSDMFLKEAHGLKELSSAQVIRIPKVLAVDEDFLLLEFIESGSKPKNFWKIFGKRFAQMHRHHSEYFGFEEDNYCGLTPQINQKQNQDLPDAWSEFYFKNRLEFQVKLAEQRGHGSELSRLLAQLETKIHELLSASKEPPSLLHGDLWGGNYLVDEQGEPTLIDPAAYYGHREADLAMTVLFGSFTEEFYAAYAEEYPLALGWQERQGIYKLYHVLNHLNLFGSGYYAEAQSILKSYL